MEIHSKSTRQIVAAIDIGTTHSGYAFSVKNDWGKVYTCMWVGGSLVSSKAPTSLLLKDDFTESYFGYVAEDRYADLKSDDSHQNYYFFQRFKMIIHGESVCPLSSLHLSLSLFLRLYIFYFQKVSFKFSF